MVLSEDIYRFTMVARNQGNFARWSLLLFIAATLLTLSSAATTYRRWGIRRPTVRTSNRFKNGNSIYDSFDMELFQKMAQSTPGNVLVSPLNQKLLLAMIMDGATAQTANEIRERLRLPDDPYVAAREIKNWITSLNPAPTRTAGADTLTVANQIFLDKAYTPNEHYREHLKKYYLSDVQTVEKERPDKAAQLINTWVSNSTSGLIPSIIEETDINQDFVVALASSIYFKGTWLYQFKQNETKPECFYAYGQEKCTKLDMMKMWEVDFPFAYIVELDASFVALPYQDKKHSMVIVLPNERNGIDNLIKKIGQYPWSWISSKLFNTSIGLMLPKFTVDYQNDMVDIFRSLYIRRPFDMRAQLDNMVSGKAGLYISKIFHKSKIIVNEAGSEAAAASLGGVVPLSLYGSHSEAVPFIADHPFLYFIKDNSNNILFAGKFSGP